MASGVSQWVTLSGNVAAWFALIYLIIVAVWGSPELRILKDQLKNMNEILLKLIKKLPSG
jgi:choline-glycine betaine transporter